MKETLKRGQKQSILQNICPNRYLWLDYVKNFCKSIRKIQAISRKEGKRPEQALNMGGYSNCHH